MPPGNARTQVPVKVIEKVTAEACIAIARQVELSSELVGDVAGSDAARRVAAVIQAELLGTLGRASRR